MASRLQSLFSRSALIVLAMLAACDVTPEDEKLSAPPPVGMGPGKKPNVGAESGVPAGTVKPGSGGSGTTGTLTAATTAADSGSAKAQDPGMDDGDAGPRAGAGGARAGNGAAGMLAAGSGGRSGAGGRAGASGDGGTGGQGGAAGGSTPGQCQNQFCFTVFDCWLLNTSECNYSDCVNFACQ